MKNIFLILLSILAIACNSQEQPSKTLDPKAQIAQYVVNVFEDSKGHLWFGTLEKGLAKYDGRKLEYLTMTDGLPSNRIAGILEETNGVFWLGTDKGLVKYDGLSFLQFPVKDDFFNNSISTLLIDSKGTFWVGTWGGVYTFDGKGFTFFPIPYPEVSTRINKDTKNWITGIEEDDEGNIWFARDGYGVCKYDGSSFTHMLKKDGLQSNNITEIEFDNEGNLWLGSRVAERDDPDPKNRHGAGGVNKLTKDGMLSFLDVKGFNTSDVYGIYKDHAGNVWISTVANGVYKFDGKQFINFDVPISIMSMLDDQKGNLWLGGAGGLYRIDKNENIINVLQEGPWE